MNKAYFQEFKVSNTYHFYVKQIRNFRLIKINPCNKGPYASVFTI